jgi:UDPglucose 6-dehydrogenase
MKICVIGLGKLGLPIAAVLADAGHNVVGVDRDAGLVRSINDASWQTYEPGLSKLVYEHLSLTGRLKVRTEPEPANVAFVIVPTPSRDDGSFNPAAVIEAAGAYATLLTNVPGTEQPTIAVVSTLSPGTMTREVRPALDAVVRGISLVYNPTLVAIGSVVRDLKRPDVVLAGSDDVAALDRIAGIWSRVVFPGRPAKFHSGTFEEVELAKLAINAYVTMKISFANALGEIADRLGADVDRVTEMVGADRRIGRAYLRAGGPYGGPCFPRDVEALRAFSEENKTWAAFNLAKAISDANLSRMREIAGSVLDVTRYGDLVTIFGIAYKPGTALRDGSPADWLADQLNSCNRAVRLHDPILTPDLSIAAAVAGAAAIVVMTPDEAYRAVELPEGVPVIDPWRLRKGFTKPA